MAADIEKPNRFAPKMTVRHPGLIFELEFEDHFEGGRDGYRKI
jgi:hypothetical protein